MKWVLLLIGVFLLFGFAFWYVSDIKKAYKEEQNDFLNANHLKEKLIEENDKK